MVVLNTCVPQRLTPCSAPYGAQPPRHSPPQVSYFDAPQPTLNTKKRLCGDTPTALQTRTTDTQMKALRTHLPKRPTPSSAPSGALPPRKKATGTLTRCSQNSRSGAARAVTLCWT